MTDRSYSDIELTRLNCPFCGEPPYTAADMAGGVICCETDGCVRPRVTSEYLVDAIKQWNIRSSLQPATPTAGEVNDECYCDFASRRFFGSKETAHDPICPQYDGASGDAVAGDAKAFLENIIKICVAQPIPLLGTKFEFNQIKSFAEFALTALRADVAGDVQAAVPTLADVAQIVSDGWLNGKSSTEVAEGILLELEPDVARAEIERAKIATPNLMDPVAVHANMLRGTIAKPTWDQIKHLYPERFDVQAARTSMRADILDALDWLEHSAKIKDNPFHVPEIIKHNEMAAAQAERIRLALFSREAAQPSWQPIETAPKNRLLLVGFFNSVGKWRSMHAQYREDLPQHDDAADDDEPAEAGWYEGSLEAEMLFPVRPTHWQPLPAPPISSTEGKSTDTELPYLKGGLDGY